jgi:transformation/transcription domain-associated protein
MPEWLRDNRVVFDTLLLAWKSPARIARLQNEQELSLPQVFVFIF